MFRPPVTQLTAAAHPISLDNAPRLRQIGAPGSYSWGLASWATRIPILSTISVQLNSNGFAPNPQNEQSASHAHHY